MERGGGGVDEALTSRPLSLINEASLGPRKAFEENKIHERQS